MSRKDVTDVMVCHAVAEYQAAIRAGRHALYPYQALAAQTGQPEKVCWRAIERADQRGLLEWGVSLRTAWLTEAGQSLLAAKEAGE